MSHETRITVRQLVKRYSTMELPRRCEQSRINTTAILKRFVKAFGARAAESVRRIEVAEWLVEQKTWRSSHMKKNAVGAVKRLFFWGQEMELTERNPAWRLRVVWGEPARPRRAMTDEEFRSLLRNAPFYVRQLLFFVAMTGCRPGEAMRLTWEDVDLAGGVATLKAHKTFAKTGRPRKLFLPPVLVKLLAWMKTNPRRTWQRRRVSLETTSRILWDMLRKQGAVSAKRVRLEMDLLGISYRMVSRAKATIGAGFRWLGRAKGGVYFLPDTAKQPPQEFAAGFVFRNERGGRWKDKALVRNIGRLKKRIGLADDVCLYLLRHAFATRALKKGAALKLVSELIGHSRTSTTEQVYLHMDVLKDELQKAACTACEGLFR